jgi:hypothetical protein
MTDFNAFVSPEYPVLHATGSGEDLPALVPPGHVTLSLALLVKGIPSFLATIPVAEGDLHPMTDSLNEGDVRVAVVGISVDGDDLPGAPEPAEPWKADVPDKDRNLPAAFLSLICADGRRIGVARIVARENSASPEDVARFVLRQIAQGVQIPDLASTP